MTKKTQAVPPGRPGRRPALGAEHIAALRAITQEMPRSSLDEVTRELFRRTGVKVNPVTVRKALREAGIERLKPLRRAGERAAVQGAAVQGAAPTRYGYTAAHRRSDGPSGMNTDLTDAEWALVADLFERNGRPGAPPRFERRHMVNACCYALRTGCAWRLLPKTFPPWQATYKAFSRWAAAGVFEAMHDRLRQQWRDRMGKAPEPSAAIIDAQSTRSTAQGGNTGFDAGKKVKGRKRHLVVDTLGLLLAGRVLGGMTASSFSVAGAYIADVTAPEDRSRKMGLIGAMFGLGFIIGPMLGGLLGGAIITEQVFVINGVGTYLINAINQRNYPVVQSTVLVIAAMFIIVNLIVDLVYVLIDPRISYE